MFFEKGDLFMSTSVNDFVKQGRDLADQAVDTAQVFRKRGLRVARDTTKQALDVASDTADSVIRYTKKNPTKALLLAAASGAVLVTLARILSPSRD
jgi:hypothetical protein